MNRNMKMVLCLGTCMAMSACHTVTGTLSVPSGSSLQLKDKKGHIVTFNAGNAKVVMTNGKLLIKGSTTTKSSDTVELSGMQSILPQFEEDGEHVYLAKDTGQPVDIDEITTNSTSQSAEHDDWESCSVTENVEVPCPPPPPPPPPQNNNSSNDPGNGNKPNPGNNANNGGGNPANGGGNGGSNPGGGNGGHGGSGGGGGGGGHSGNGGHASVVHGFKSTRRPASGCFESRVVPGYQHVQFHYDGDSFEIQLILSDPTSKAQLGTFLGYSYASDRVVDNMGVCETNHGR